MGAPRQRPELNNSATQSSAGETRKLIECPKKRIRPRQSSKRRSPAAAASELKPAKTSSEGRKLKDPNKSYMPQSRLGPQKLTDPQNLFK